MQEFGGLGLPGRRLRVYAGLGPWVCGFCKPRKAFSGLEE